MNARCGGGVCGLVRQVLDDAAGDGCIGVGLNLFGSSEGLDQIGAGTVLNSSTGVVPD